jgi:carbon starvation protein CstA
MITFLLSIILLIIGYFTYGKYLERMFGADPARVTPAHRLADGVDYEVLDYKRVYIIQFLNIAGLGPIFGAILGAAYGPLAYLWIIVGCIFMGAAHDYVSGMLSVRNDGSQLPGLAKRYLGQKISVVMVVFNCFLLLAVGSSFVNGPADLLNVLTNTNNIKIWLFVIFAYYICATLLPISKIIGKIYPYMGAVLILMAVMLFGAIIYHGFSSNPAIHCKLMELTPATFHNFKTPSPAYLIPMLFITISCGAISGFHGTQSPLMARCIENEKYGRKVFYGAMITEGIVASIWATAAIAFYNGADGLNVALAGGMTPAKIIHTICYSWLGKFGAVIAIIGVIVCPITSGDTAFRSMRIVIADAFGIGQKKIKNRIYIAIPIFFLAFLVSNMEFTQIWNLVGISNQTLAAITLWTCAAYLASEKKCHWIMTLPAMFLTFICVAYIMMAPSNRGGFHLAANLGYIIAVVTTLVVTVIFLFYAKSDKLTRLVAEHANDITASSENK